jgi:hypothetical protein
VRAQPAEAKPVALAAGRLQPVHHSSTAMNKCLAQSNKTRTGGAQATNKRGALPAARAILRAPPIGKTRCGSALPVVTTLVMKHHNVEIGGSVPRDELQLRKALDIMAGKEPLHVHTEPLPADAAPTVIAFTEEPLV